MAKTEKKKKGISWSPWGFGCMEYTERTKMAAVSCGTSHVSAVSGHSKAHYKQLVTHVDITGVCEHNESAWGQRIALYKSDQQPIPNKLYGFCEC